MLIGLHGKARSGKDTTYQFVHEWADTQGRPVRRDAFADRLKLSAARALGFTGDLAEAIAFCDDLKENRHVGFATVVHGIGGEVIEYPSAFITGRAYLQFYGTEAHREVFGDEVWVNLVLEDYLYGDDPAEIVVITDVRFENEATAISDCGGEVWQILRPAVEIVENSHASEQALDPSLINRVINNATDLYALRDMVYAQMDLVYA